MKEKIRVLIVHAHPLVYVGLYTTLAAHEDIVIERDATTNHEALQLCQELQPDVLLLDSSISAREILPIVKHIWNCTPDIKIIILVSAPEIVPIRNLISIGVVGCILQSEAPEAVIHAIRTTIGGGTWFSRSVLEELIQQREADPIQPLLTKNERNLLEMIAQGWDNSRIATELNLAEQTVRNYVSRLYMILDVRSRAEAIVWAREHYIGGTPWQHTNERSVSY